MSGLSRDILKWIQSLDLSYAIKNVRRDFSNGFLIAEILSRYFRSDITMHSYDHGTAVSKKIQNWNLLEKFFARQGWPIEKPTIQGVIHCDQGSAVHLLEQLYTLLTHKTVPNTQLINHIKNVEYIPPYAQPTTNMLIRERLNKSDMNEREQPQDLTSTILTTQRVMIEHNHALRLDKTQDPARYQPVKRESLGKKEKILSPKPTSTMRQVIVKQADGLSSISTTLTSQMAAMIIQPQQQIQQQQQPVAPQQTCIQLMDSVVAVRLEGQDILKKFDPRLPLSVCLMDHISSLSDDVLSDLFADLLHSCVSDMSQLCLQNPKEFWQITGIWWKAVESLDASSLAFREVLYVISSLGAHMLERDITTPFALLSDFLFSKIITLIQSTPTKLSPIISMLYTYVMDDIDEHIRIMNYLKENIKDASILIKCYATLLQLENEFSAANLDLYLNYINIGLNDASPSIRAVSLSMLASIAVKQRIDGATIVVNMLDRLTPQHLGTDWIILAQLCHLLTALLTQPSIINNISICNNIYPILSSILTKDSDTLVLRAGLASLTRCLNQHQQMRMLFVEVLKQREDVTEILLTEKRQGEDGQGEIDVHCPKIRRLWHPLSVAQAVQEHVKSGREQNLLPVHIDLLSAVLSTLPSFPQHELSSWIDIFISLRDEILVELCDPKMCRGARLILDVYIKDQQTQDQIKQLMIPDGDSAPRLYGVMPYIFPKTNLTTQTNFITMLEEWISVPGCVPLLERLLSNFARNEPASFTANPALPALLQRLTA